METYRKSLNSVFLFRIRTATLMTALCVFMLAAGAANAVTYTDSSPQTTEGQDFIFTFSPVNPWNVGNGTFTVHARCDYSVSTPSEYLDWDIDGLVSGRAAPSAGGTVIQTFNGSDIEWEQSFMISGGLMNAITLDSSIAISIDLSSAVAFQIDPSTHFVEVELTYNASGPQCAPPPAPDNPDPCDGTTNVPIDTCLSWSDSGVTPPPGNIVINEIDIGESDTIELFNPTGAPVDLTGWQVIAISDNGTFNVTYMIPAFTLNAGAYVAIHKIHGMNTNTNLFIGRNIDWVGVDPGSCSLVDAGSVGIDFVRWSDNTGAELSTDLPPAGTNWTGNDPMAPVNENLHSLGRNALSTDTDNGSDWENTSGVDADGKTTRAANIGGATVTVSTEEPQIDIDIDGTSEPESPQSIDEYDSSAMNLGGSQDPPIFTNHVTMYDAPSPVRIGGQEWGIRHESLATEVVIPFDELAEDTVVTDQYAALGVIFGSWNGGTPTARIASKPVIPSEPMGLSCLPYVTTDHLINFLTPTTSAGAIIDFGMVGSGIKIEAFDGPDATGNLLASNSTTVEEFLGVTAPGIASLKFSQVNYVDSTSYLIDNFTFSSSGCSTTWDVYLGTDPGSLGLVANNLADPNYCPGGLETGETYFWQVIAKNPSGETPGNVWSFETEGGDPPECNNAVPSVAEIWPPRHEWVDIEILDVNDPDSDPVSIIITGITQDEPVAGHGSGKTSPDGMGVGTSVAHVRAERSDQSGNGRIYEISFEADDGTGNTCNGSVKVCVPHDQGRGHECVDDGQLYDSTATEMFSADLNGDGIINQLDFNILARYWLVSYELED